MADMLEILDERNVPYVRTNNPYEIKIECTSGLHEDNNPTLAYNLEENIFHCWACDFSGGHKKFLSSIGVSSTIPIESKQGYKLQKLKAKIRGKMHVHDITLPKDVLPIPGYFKGIEEDLLNEFGAFLTDDQGFQDYLCIPVYQFGKLRFIEGRLRFTNSDKPKYLRKPNNVVVSDILFPIDSIADKSHLILVEGLFDMINMWQLGYKNTVCIFGTGNFSNKKAELLDKLGTLSVDILMDGDIAGKRAAARIEGLLEKRDIATKIHVLPEGQDPGILNFKQAERLFK